MKIICIAQSFNGAEKQIFIKPDTALHNSELPLYLPDFVTELSLEIGLAVKVTKQGKHIAAKFAHKYFEQIAIGVNFVAHELQNELQKKGLPWDKAVGFDSSFLLSNFIAVNELSREFLLTIKTGTIEKQVHMLEKNVVEEIASAIEDVSKFFTLRTGDVIFLGTAAKFTAQIGAIFNINVANITLNVAVK